MKITKLKIILLADLTGWLIKPLEFLKIYKLLMIIRFLLKISLECYLDVLSIIQKSLITLLLWNQSSSCLVYQSVWDTLRQIRLFIYSWNRLLIFLLIHSSQILTLLSLIMVRILFIILLIIYSRSLIRLFISIFVMFWLKLFRLFMHI